MSVRWRFSITALGSRNSSVIKRSRPAGYGAPDGFAAATSGALELVVRDLVHWNLEVREHSGTRLDYHRRTAEIVLGGCRERVFPQVLVEHNLMDEPDVTRPVVLRLRRRMSQVEREVVVR